jgi:putative transposase
MPRISRAVAIGYPHHVLQRGKYRQPIFEEDIDYLQYLQWLDEYSKKFSLKIWAYCLMSNHVYYVAVPIKENSLSKTFNFLHMKYSLYFNQRKDIKAHLWQGRFLSCILDDRHVYEEVRFIENNPVHARIVKRAEDYPWSSARSHVYGEPDLVLSDECYLVREISDWRAYLAEKGEELLVRRIRKNIRTGRPCGDEEFVRRLEELLHRRLSPLPRGRPQKVKQYNRILK